MSATDRVPANRRSGRTISAVVIVTAVLYSAAIAFGLVSFAQWDNIEAFLPGIWYGHTTLLSGSFPLWNPHQNLGEPLHAFGYAGLLYPIYTALVVLVRAIGASPVLVLQLSAVLHASAAAAAMCGLARAAGGRTSLAVAAGLTLAGAGYGAVAGTVWVHVWPNLLWQILGMRAVLALLRRGPSTLRILAAAVCMAVPFLTGHVQTGAIAVLAVWVWGLLLLWLDPTTRPNGRAFLLAALAGPLLAAPAILPTLATLAGSARISLLTFGDQQVRPDALLGMLAGAVELPAGFMDQPSALALFVGAWVPVALAAALVHRPSPGRTSPTFTSAGLAAALFLALSLGSTGVVYLVLRLLPFWSDTQGPFKFLASALPFLVLAGTLAAGGLTWADHSRTYRFVALGGLAVAATAVIVAPPINPAGWLLAAFALLQIAVLLGRPRVVSIALPAISAIVILCVFGSARSPDHPKAYRAENDPGFSPAQLELLRRGRVLPLSSASVGTPRVRALATFNAPMLDRYSSATGQRFALSAQLLDGVLPAQFDGVPFPDATRRVLGSDWPYAARIATLIVRHDDVVNQHLIAELRPAARELFRTSHAVAYSVGNIAPEVFAVAPALATDALPAYGALNRSDVAARIERVRGELPEMRLQIQSATPIVVVASMLLSRELKVTVDGQAAQPRAVFGGLTSIDLDAGQHEVTFALRRWPVAAGAITAAVTLLLLVLLSRGPRGQWTSPEN